eukprot:TRINITY_DN410_c0_g1_i1.p1 TRINITY_DN410_c0_g1~~TRINITY_DN410_c0_g1_i1.p1  ORF type:complete len:342 (-),score=91.93 TRINITY_DN410_c0_g1_i1:80-1105(-)
MHSDDVIWGLINKSFCSFKVKTITSDFCRNEYNVNGHCSRSTCPLANSQYATIREKDGKCSLYIKTVERQHMPNKLWEIIPLDKNLEAAFKQIDDELIHWNPFMIHKCKQRLVKITQYLIRMRRLRKQPERTMHRVHKKVERRERGREERAEQVAQIDNKIKAELLERLKQGTYGDIYNFRPEAWNEVLDEEEGLSVEEDAPEFIADEESEDWDKEAEEERYEEYGGFSSGDDDEDDDDDDDEDEYDDFDDEDIEDKGGVSPKKGKGFGEFTKGDFDDSMFDISATKGAKPAGKAAPSTAPTDAEKKRKRPSDGKGRAGKKKKTHIEIEYEDKEQERVENW